jgi:hypothetical protein
MLTNRLAMIAAVAFWPAAAVAQEAVSDPGKTPEVVERLFDCRTIEDSGERLACFDREIDSVLKAQESKELVITDREQIKETRRGLFGFSLPKIGLFGGEDDDDEVNEIVAKISEARRTRNGRYMIVLEDGARWMQSDNTTVLRDIEPGEEITIKTAAFGSYMAKVGGRRAFRIKRMN